MAICRTGGDRFTSSEIVAEWQPCAHIPAGRRHIQQLRFNPTVTAGTFRLRVNGERTAAITFSATAATLITSINTALDNLGILAAAEIVASGTDVSNITLTSSATTGLKFYEIEVTADLLTGATNSDPNVTTDVTQFGTTVYRISGDVTQIDWSTQVETTNSEGIADFEEEVLAVMESMTVDLTLYRTTKDWQRTAKPGMNGVLTIYQKGKITGLPIWRGMFLVESADESMPKSDLVTMDLSLRRQGALLIPIDSVWDGSE
jgi:hypothetical protein